MDKAIIESFSIRGLFGIYDLEIPFRDNTFIIYSENGSGKTQVLNMLYYALSGNFLKLLDFSFNTLTLRFLDNFTIDIERKFLEDLIKYLLNANELVNHRNSLGISDFNILMNCFMQNSNSNIATDRYKLNINYSLILLDATFNQKLQPRRLSIINVITQIYEIKNNYISNLKSEYATNFINSENYTFLLQNEFSTLYFPTFRRSETNPKNSSYLDSINNQVLFNPGYNINEIHSYGMKDIEIIVNNTISVFDEIFQSFQSQDIIMTLIKDYKLNAYNKVDINNIIKSKEFDLIINRLILRLSDEEKKKFRNMIDNIINNIINSENKFHNSDKMAMFIMENIFDIFESFSLILSKVEKFIEVCNHYLSDKQIQFNVVSGTFKILSTIKRDQIIPLNHLSSGEKQIVSLFAKLYFPNFQALNSPMYNRSILANKIYDSLKNENKIILFFDEPELSLSVFWQQRLLPDILETGRINFMLVSSHSPFIIENDLVNNAHSLSEYFI